jgi:DNA-binding beta-propeller fold protein YncE
MSSEGLQYLSLYQTYQQLLNQPTSRSANMSTLAVVSQSGQTLNFFDVESGLRTGQMTDLIAEPHEMCLDDRTGLLYISHTYQHGWYASHGDFVSLISVLDCKSKTFVATIDIKPCLGPHYLQIDKDRNLLYASVEGGIAENTPDEGGIVGIDLHHRTVVKRIGSDHKSHWFVMTPDGSKAYTCNKEAGFISVIDLVGDRLLQRIDLPGGCEQPGISRDGSLVFFPSPAIGQAGYAPSIKVIDTSSDKILHCIPLETGAITVHVDPLDRLLVGLYRIELDRATSKPIPSYGGVACFRPEGSNYERLFTVETGLVPLTIISHPDASKAFASNIFHGTLSVIDLKLSRVIKTLEVDTESRQDKVMHQGAHGLALI